MVADGVEVGPLDGQWLIRGVHLWTALDIALDYSRAHDGELPVQTASRGGGRTAGPAASVIA